MSLKVCQKKIYIYAKQKDKFLKQIAGLVFTCDVLQIELCLVLPTKLPSWKYWGSWPWNCTSPWQSSPMEGLCPLEMDFMFTSSEKSLRTLFWLRQITRHLHKSSVRAALYDSTIVVKAVVAHIPLVLAHTKSLMYFTQYYEFSMKSAVDVTEIHHQSFHLDFGR